MKLLTGLIENTASLLVEENNGVKEYYLEGIYMQSNKKNRNGRIYPKGVLEASTEKFKNEYVTSGRAMGELGHPEGPAINLDRVSHRITKLEWNGDDVIGRSLVLETPFGTILKGLLRGGCKLGVSSRGLGSVTSKSGQPYVNEGFILSTVDAVHDPSAPAAFVNGILEGVEYYFEGNDIVAVESDKLKEKLHKLSVKKINEQSEEFFKKYMKTLSEKYTIL